MRRAESITEIIKGLDALRDDLHRLRPDGDAHLRACHQKLGEISTLMSCSDVFKQEEKDDAHDCPRTTAVAKFLREHGLKAEIEQGINDLEQYDGEINLTCLGGLEENTVQVGHDYLVLTCNGVRREFDDRDPSCHVLLEAIMELSVKS